MDKTRRIMFYLSRQKLNAFEIGQKDPPRVLKNTKKEFHDIAVDHVMKQLHWNPDGGSVIYSKTYIVSPLGGSGKVTKSTVNVFVTCLCFSYTARTLFYLTSDNTRKVQKD